MSLEKNDRDIELLKEDPKEFVVTIQNLVEIVINQFVKVGKFSQADRDDIKQLVNEELLRKIHKIRVQFNNQSLVRTYMTVIIRNICSDILRSTKNKIDFVSHENLFISDNTNIINSMMIGEEIVRLQNAINLYYKQKFKIILCLKLYFRIPVEFDDFLMVNRSISFQEFETFVNNIKPYEDCNDYTIFSSLIVIFNRIEVKNNTPDALRKWIQLKINELILLLNGNANHYFYTKESFQLLFEYCYVSENKLSV